MNIGITNESRSKINFKCKKILKSSITSKFVEQLFNVYTSFLIFKFSKIRQSFRLTLRALIKNTFRHEIVFVKTKLDVEIALSTRNCFNLKL